MTSVQLHLALSHVPVIVSVIGFIMLAVALFLKNNLLTKASYVLLIVAGLATAPVYLTGEGAEETVENLPGITESVIESHEDFAAYTLISIVAAGLAALAALAVARLQAVRAIPVSVFLIALISCGLSIQTASLGGKIRHTEINGAAIQNGSEQSMQAKEKDDD